MLNTIQANGKCRIQYIQMGNAEYNTYKWEMPNTIQAVATSRQQPGDQSTLASAEKEVAN